jgi:hypothetical protein
LAFNARQNCHIKLSNKLKIIKFSMGGFLWNLVKSSCSIVETSLDMIILNILVSSANKYASICLLLFYNQLNTCQNTPTYTIIACFIRSNIL